MAKKTSVKKSGKNTYEGPVQYTKAALALCEHLRMISKVSNGTDVSIYAFGHKGFSFRIAEIGFSKQKGRSIAGSCYMRTDFGNGDLFLAAEDFVMYSMDDFGGEPGMFRDETLERITDVWKGMK